MAQVFSCTVYPTKGGTVGTQGISATGVKRVYAATHPSNAAIVTAIEMKQNGSQPTSSIFYTNSTVAAIITAANA